MTLSSLLVSRRMRHVDWLGSRALPSDTRGLTARALEVLRLVAVGKRNRDLQNILPKVGAPFERISITGPSNATSSSPVPRRRSRVRSPSALPRIRLYRAVKVCSWCSQLGLTEAVSLRREPDLGEHRRACLNRRRVAGRRQSYAERLVVLAALPVRRWPLVRLLMPELAFFEPLANAALASSRTGARSATTRIPYGFVLSRGLVTPPVYAVKPDGIQSQSLTSWSWRAPSIVFRMPGASSSAASKIELPAG
jgi:hypothetical protein